MTIDERPRWDAHPRRGPRMTQAAAVSPRGGGRTHPVNCWYVAATSDEVGQAILGRRIADVGVAMYRTRTGEVVACWGVSGP